VGILTVPNIILTPPGARNISARMAGLPWGPDYIEKIQRMFGTSLIGLWSHGEPPGSTASVDHSPFGYHGAYTSVQLGQQGVWDGLTCARFDGTTSYMQPPTGFRAAFNPLKGTIACMAKMFNLGVWTDAAIRTMFRVGVDGNNFVLLWKSGTNNTLASDYRANAVVKQLNVGGNSDTDWFHFALTWDMSVGTGEMKMYKGGFQIGNTLTGLGVWAGTPVAGITVVGCSNVTGPAQVTNGWLEYSLALNRAASPSEVAEMARG